MTWLTHKASLEDKNKTILLNVLFIPRGQKHAPGTTAYKSSNLTVHPGPHKLFVAAQRCTNVYPSHCPQYSYADQRQERPG